MAITPATRKEDDKLREKLKNADLKKFDKAIKSIFSPAKKRKGTDDSSRRNKKS